MVVLVVQVRNLLPYQHAAAAAACPQVLRVGRPRGASKVTALFHQLASAARNAAQCCDPRGMPETWLWTAAMYAFLARSNLSTALLNLASDVSQE